jgi:hypothetical protein
MPNKYFLFIAVSLVAVFSSFTPSHEISSCFISFKGSIKLKTLEPDRLPENSEKVRKLKTDNGDVDVSRVDGYRVLYNNDKNVPFVNLKVELSSPESYEKDKIALVDNLKYLNSHSVGMETQDLIELHFNGYRIFGLSRGSIEAGSNLGTFVMFPGNGVTVYFYFNNLKPEYRNFESVEEYKKLRDNFIDSYTKHIKTCK